MKDPKNAAIQYFNTDRTLLGGRNLYNQLPGKNLAIQRTLARMTGTEREMDKLHYEIAKAAGIGERELKILLQKPKKSVKEMSVVSQTVNSVDKEKLNESLLEFDAKNTKYNTAVVLAKSLGLKLPNKQKATVDQALEGARDELCKKLADELPMQTKASIKLREQFPFIGQKDCPEALKVLVHDLISAYDRFREEQPKLHELMSQEEEKRTVDLVLENYISNKEAWAELEHYNDNKEILGKHPIFEMIKKKAEISDMATADLVRKIQNLKINIGKNREKGNDEFVARDEELLAHAKTILDNR